ncbi:hypothetical protein ABMA27_003425 [Loxostege sticticalis]|uniref:FP protein C-terminal domain-containing protein n=1 Tax=Loxostege sticticalis TaxID=481309 RepID=A0ABR3HT19_LOXSC
MGKTQRTPPSSPKQGIEPADHNPIEQQQSYVTNRPNKRQALSNHGNIISTVFANLPVTQQDVREIVTDIVQTQMAFFLTQMNENFSKTFNKELSSLKNEIENVRSSMDFMNEKFEDAMRGQATLVKEMEEIKTQNEILKGTQNSRMNNVEVQCVLESKNENLNTIIIQIAKTVGCSLTEENITHCTRVAKNDKTNTRPRAIIAQLSSIRLRDTFLAAAITFNKLNKENKLNSSHIGIAGEKKPIYIMEHLSPANKSLHAAARIKSKELGYKYVWTRNGRIFMRKSDNTPYIVVKDTDFLNKLQ